MSNPGAIASLAFFVGVVGVEESIEEVDPDF
jgi:hypothetical protein